MYIVLSIVNGVFVVKTKLDFFQAVLYSAFPKQTKKKMKKGKIFLLANSKVKVACTYIAFIF